MKNTLLFKKSNGLLFWSLAFFLLLNTQVSWGQLFQQQFGTNVTAFSNGNLTNTTYINASPSNSQFTNIGSGGTGATISIADNKLTLARTGNSWNFVRGANGFSTASALMVRFDYETTSTGGATTSSVVLAVGGGNAASTAGTTLTAADIHSRLAFNSTANAGEFVVRDIAGSTNGATTFSGVQTITWVINNSGGTLTYYAPNGTFETVANDRFDVWVGTSKQLNERSPTTANQTLSFFKCISNSGTQTVNFSNMLINPIPAVPTSDVADNITSSSFRANWATVDGVTGYRVDVATDAAFTSMVPGWSNVYVAGQTSTSLTVNTNLTGSTEYYYRVRGASQYTVGEFAGGNSGTQTLTTTTSGGPTSTITGTLSEATLNTATVGVTLANETFADATLSAANFTLTNAPTGITVASVVHNSPTSATITLAYDNTDFDTNVTTFNVTIAGIELTSGNSLSSNNLTITAVTEALTVGAIASFGNQCVNLLSTEEQFTISGTNLKAGTISLGALPGFTYSETAGGTYTSTLSFTNAAGTLTNKNIFVKFLPTSVQSFNGNITVSGSGAPTVNRSVVGSGVNSPPTVTTPTSTAFTTSTATLGGNLTALGCSTVTTIGIEYSTTNNFVNGTGTVVSESSASYATGTFTIPVSGLNGGTLYYYKAFATSTGGTAYSAQGSFTTLFAEPSNHPTNFAAGTVTVNTIIPTWVASVAGTQAPAGYLIKASNTNVTTVTDPVDGVDPANSTVFGLGIANVKVTPGTATTAATFTSMISGVMYNYKIYPYTGSGTGINYKIADATEFNHATLPTRPNAPVSSNLQASSATLSWTLGSHPVGNKVLVFVKAGSAVTTGTPTNAPSTYTENTIFGSGTAFQNDAAAFCVYKGDGSSVNITGLDPNTTYHLAIYRVVEASNSIGTNSYSAVLAGNFTTLVNPVSVPYTQNFEGTTNEWVLDAGAAGTNKWAIGAATNNGGTNALYISNDNGVSNAYSVITAQAGTNASLRVDLTGLTNATLSFEWKSNGEILSGTIWDYGEVYINNGGGDILISSTQEFYNTATFALKTIDLTAYAGQIVTVKFRWVNDGSAGSQPPFAVDNVSIVPYSLPSFTTAAITSLTYNTATSGGTITNDAGSAITARGIVYDTAPSPTLSSTVVNSGSGIGTYTSNLTGLLSNTTYYVRAYVTNANGTSYANQIIFTTPSISAPEISPESAILSNGFTANWQPVLDATSYELDVSLYPNFEVGGGLQTLSEGFTTYVSQSSLNNFSFTGTSSYDTAGSSGTTGPRSVKFDDEDDSIVSPLLAGNATELKFWLRNNGWGGAVGNNLIVEGFNGTSWVIIETILSSAVASTAGPLEGSSFIYNASSTPVLPSNITRFRFTIKKTTGNVAFDDFEVTYNTSIPSFIAGYDGLNVGAVTSHDVTGLDPETTYHYRVRAIRDTDKSVNSSPETVITGSPATIWTVTSPAILPAWTNGVPTATTDAVIDADYDETEAITAKNLTINATAILTVTPTQTLSVAGNLVNNGEIIFESDATGTARFGSYTGTADPGTGVSTVERYIPARRAWRLLTAPLMGTTNNSISANWQGTNGEGLLLFSPASLSYTGYTTGGTSPNIRKYVAGAFANIPNLTTEPMFGTNVADTKAFLVFPTGPSDSGNIASGAAATTLRPKGKLITGTVTHELNANQFTLIANPYASAIDPALLVGNNAGSKLWLINPSVGLGAYVTFDGNWSIEPETVIDGYVQSGQGFFARTANASNFSITENDKVVGNSNNWFEKSATNVETESVDKIRVLLYKQEASNWTIADGILGVNQLSGNNEVDAKDANKISNFNESLMFRNNTSNLSIEYRALPQLGDIQPLRMTGTTAIPYQLRIFTQEYINSTLQPYLEDTTTGSLTAIPLDGSQIIVPFTGIVSTSTNPDNRFRLVYQVNLNTVENSPLVASVFPNPVTNNQLNIHLGTNNEPAKYTITNLLGQAIQNGSLYDTQNVITLSGVNQGFYILNIIQEGKSFTTKIYVQ